MKLLITLFLTFAKVGLFTFGGGYAMISMIEDVCVAKKGWITHEEMMEITCATYVGYKHGGIWGSIAATVGMVVPSFLIIFLISGVLDHFLLIPVVANAFKGIKVGVGLLILRVAITMVKKMPKKPFPLTIAGCAFAAVLVINFLSLKISTIVLLLLAGAVSFSIFLCKKAGGAKK